MAIGRTVAILLLYSVGVLECLDYRVVDTNAGSFRGAIANDGDYYEFMGIPFGRVDAANPFGVATPYPTISEIYEANDDSAKCPQLGDDGVISGSLDCLRLNVYVPNTATDTSQFPVMVFIHGGFFHLGHASRSLYGPKFLVRHDVIIVTITYRVGPYGFMCLGRRTVPGNQGLKDQVLALKWVRDNIKAFGGNPDQVTLFGQSAGAHSVDFHLLSKHEKLYNKVIMQSGSSLAQTVNYEPDREAPIKLASFLGLDHSSVSEALTSLTNAPTDDVIRAAIQLNMQFKPCAETQFEDVEAFITDYWINSPVPKAKDVPIIIGFTKNETLLAHLNASPEHFQSIKNLVYDSLKHTFDFDEDKMNRMEEYMRTFYFGGSTINQDVVEKVTNFQSDHLYNHPVQRSMKKFVEGGASNIFYYIFSYSGGRNQGNVQNLNVQAAVHNDDVRYLFDMASIPAEVSPQDQLTIDRMTTMWTNFAKFSDPTPETNTLLPIKWTPVTNSVYHYLDIDAELSMGRRPFNRRMAFMDLFYKLNHKDQRIYEAAEAAEDDDDSGSIVVTGSLFNVLLTSSLIICLKGNFI